MSTFSPLIDKLIESLCCLPGVGPKSAQRMAFYLLERGRDSGRQLAQAMEFALKEVRHCEDCRNFTESHQCGLCKNPYRDPKILCIAESPADVLAIEQTASFKGLYFVLMGHLSPIDGIGPEELGIDQLIATVQKRQVSETILATNPTVEGEATAHYLGQLLRAKGIKVSRIAHGVPLGGSLEYLDAGTLMRALSGRTLVEN